MKGLKKSFYDILPIVIHKTNNRSVSVPAEYRRYIDIALTQTRYLIAIKPNLLKKHPALVKKEKE